MVVRYNQDIGYFDPYNSLMGFENDPWYEYLVSDDWTLNPSVFDYTASFRPSQYVKGWLAASWEISDPSTYTVHLRQGIHWQNIPPVNGRELTANDVKYSYDRIAGLGSGFTKPASAISSSAYWAPLKSVTAIDKYTVAFNWGVTNPEAITEPLQSPQSLASITAPETVQLWGNINDWHHQIGTGPFILTDYVSGSSETMVKNPDYWGYDERYPQNKLPYLDKVTALIIPDNATAMAAVRTGKIDSMDNVMVQDALNLKKTNPEIVQLTVPLGNTPTVDPRNDVAPFNDIRVRTAMQMAVDLPTIAKTYYSGYADPTPVGITTTYQTGYAWPYAQWPQSLKDEYAYNPTAAKQLLAAAGYPNGFKTDFVVPNNADLGLFQIVQSYFASIGINMSINAMDPVAFTAFVVTNRKQDALAARTNGSLGTSSAPLMHLTRLLITNSANYMRIDDSVYNTLYAQAVAGTSIADVQKTSIAMDKEVVTQHFVVCLPTPVSIVVAQPWLKGFAGQNFATGMAGGAGPQLLGFYGARFWVDQNLKKSLGH